MAKKFVLDLKKPYRITVLVTLRQGDEEFEQTIVVDFNHTTDVDFEGSFSNRELCKIIVNCFDTQDKNGKDLKGEDLKSFLFGYPDVQNAIISAWQEARSKKNLRIT